MKELNRKNAQANQYPERIIQFGDGNFLRGFVEWIVWKMNQQLDFNSSIVVVKPRKNGSVEVLNAQDGLYHLNLQGIDNGLEVDTIEPIDVITRGLNPYHDYRSYLELAANPDMRFVFSNTTEAGIIFDPACKLEDAPASSFPGKLTQLLFHRFQIFQGALDKGLLIFPCELIFHNGEKLKECIEQYISLWALGDEFKLWFDTACGVYSTLVDRIVPGFPKDTISEIEQKTQFKDQLVVKAEIYHLWVIEAPVAVANEFPADKAGLNVLFVPSEKPYHERKVTLLNAPHTALSAVGYLCGLDTVREIVEHEVMGEFVKKLMFNELLSTLNHPKAELERYGNAILDRFRNPFVKHYVTSIMLNSFAKYKARILPALKIYTESTDQLPSALVLGLAGILTYYKGGKRDEQEIVPNDDAVIITFMTEVWSLADIDKVAPLVLGATFIWDEDLTQINGLTDKLAEYLTSIQEIGMLETVKGVLAE